MKYIFLFSRTTLLEFVCVSEIALSKYIKRYNYIEKKKIKKLSWYFTHVHNFFQYNLNYFTLFFLFCGEGAECSLYFLIYILMIGVEFDDEKKRIVAARAVTVSGYAKSVYLSREAETKLARFENRERKNDARRKRRNYGRSVRKWSNSGEFPGQDRSGWPNRFDTPTPVSITRRIRQWSLRFRFAASFIVFFDGP